MLGRNKQAQAYLKKANETYQAVMVSERCIVLGDRRLSSPSSRSGLPWANIINNQVQVCIQCIRYSVQDLCEFRWAYELCGCERTGLNGYLLYILLIINVPLC